MTSLLTKNAAIVEALGWTILHSLWQATLLAGVLWLVSRLTRSARARYSLAYGTLVAQLAVSLITFSWLFEVDVAETVHTAVGPLMMTDFAASGTGITYWNPGMLLFWIVVFWAVGLLIGTVRLSISFGRVRRMQTTVEGAVPDQFRATVVALAKRIGYHGPLHLRISTELGGPALVGHFKPLLLFPIAVVNQLSTEEAEAVILHELAHLKRNDHWWNLIQCLIEVVFYYHPVVWWIGARIREEREHCCDDLVLRHGPGRLAYAKALLYFEHQRATPATAVALTNNPSGLLGRVKRFVHQQNIPYQMKSRLFLLPLLTLIALISTAVYNPAEKAFETVADISETAVEAVGTAIKNRSFAPAAAPKIASLPISPLAQDSLPAGRHKVSSYRNGSSTEVVVEDRAIQQLTIDGKVIPESEFDQHEAMVERLLGSSGDRSPMQIRGWSDQWSEEDKLYRLERLNGLRSLESIRGLEGLRSLEELESLEGLEGLEGLRGLEGLEGLRGLEGLEGLRGLEGLQGLEGLRSLEGLKELLKDSGETWQEFGERMGEMGDEINRSFRGTIELHEDGQIRRFNIDKDSEPFIFDSDSLPKGGSIRFNTERNVWEMDGRAMPLNGAQDKASEIEEMETMIKRLERRKAQMQRDLERAERDGNRAEADQDRTARDQERTIKRVSELEARNLQMHEEHLKAKADYKAMVGQLQREGLLEGDDELTKLVFDINRLKVNGKTASSEAHQRFLELYQQQTGKALGKDSSVKVSTGKFKH